MDALTMADVTRMQKAGLLTLEEFLKEVLLTINRPSGCNLDAMYVGIAASLARGARRPARCVKA